jgi:hypothetical protein
MNDSTACLYEAVGCVTGLGEPFGTGYWLNDGCFAWVIDVDNYCCEVEWDESCQSIYNYCQEGWPISVDDVSGLGVIVYPNPTSEFISIETRLSIEIELYNIVGLKVIETTKHNQTTRLDLSNVADGLYMLSIIHKGKRYSKRIVKQ